jgi:hypothetical protein
MTSNRVKAALIGVSALLLAASGVMLLRGCLEDDGFPEDVAGICRVVAERFQELQPSPPLTVEQARARVEELLETSRSADEALAELDDEAPDEGSYEAWLAAREQVAERLEAALAALEKGETVGYDEALEAANGEVAERRRLAREAGFEECARLAGSGA